jgi:thiol-disulfide isomerase/thioredoxin
MNPSLTALTRTALFGAALAAVGCGEKTPPAPAAAPAGPEARAAWTTDYEAAVRRSKAEKKPLLLLFTGSDWCPPCKKLHEEVFATDVFLKWAAKRVVLVELDFPRLHPIDPVLKERNAAFTRILNVDKFPTVVFLDDLGNERARFGYQPGGPEPWIRQVEEALKDVVK